MPKYLVKAKYSAPQGIKALMEDGGATRAQAVEKLMRSLGGKLESFYFAFGETDVYSIVDLPDNEAAAAMSVTVAASGDATLELVTLMTVAEFDAALRKSPVYDSPGKD